jgi:crotonobetainyl-CoA:carnitine CoA-transferase CaiB-like acyl-CoA transferase
MTPCSIDGPVSPTGPCFVSVRNGPTCCRILDFGADVIKIEAPPDVYSNENMSGARDGFDMLSLHRNKGS